MPSTGMVNTPFLRASSVNPHITESSIPRPGFTTNQECPSLLHGPNEYSLSKISPMNAPINYDPSKDLSCVISGPVNQPSFRRQTQASSHELERLSPTPRILGQMLPPSPVSQPISMGRNGSRGPPVLAPAPSTTSLGKRKAMAPEEDDDKSKQHSANGGLSEPLIKRERLMPATPDIKPSVPISILPLPLPSKRFKKHPSEKALLIPVEQLPVFALPPLPSIRDSDLATQVFTHQSLFKRHKGRFEDPDDQPARHYEKLEHVGDSILGVVVTTWLHEIRPNLTIGTATKLKAHLVSNATLSHISGLYNLPQRLNGDPEILPVLRAQTDVRAALVEAYIAALYFSFPVADRLGEGMRAIDRWLREMYEPLYDFFYVHMKSEYERNQLEAANYLQSMVRGTGQLQSEEEIARIDQQSQGMAKLVEMYASARDRELRWEEERFDSDKLFRTNVGGGPGIAWKIRCTVDGIEVGEAVRSEKKVAKNVAGWQAAKKLGITSEV